MRFGGKRAVRLAVAVLASIPVVWLVWANATYPSDRTPEGAYLRVMSAVNRGRPEQFFAYIETRAQHACYTIRDYRKRSRERVLAAYPEPERTRLARLYEPEATAPDGADVFALYARRRGWMDRLRRDLSGIAKVERKGERATVETVRKTRYPFRIRPENGIYGLTLFTAELVAEAERAARDHALIEKAAADYERAAAAQRR
ncbi:MAG TPA: hypothetical protein VKY73_14690 [Polyangiaceae bacterium]|nr:hypothetical protein [Polyangiaceae bacterium]